MQPIEKDIIVQLLNKEAYQGQEILNRYRAQYNVLYSDGFHKYFMEILQNTSIVDDQKLMKLYEVSKLLLANKYIINERILETVDYYKMYKLIDLSNEIEEERRYTNPEFQQLCQRIFQQTIDESKIKEQINKAFEKATQINDSEMKMIIFEKLEKIAKAIDLKNTPYISVQQLEDSLERSYQSFRLTQQQEKINKERVQDVIDELLQKIDFSVVGIKDIYFQFFGSTLNGFGTTSSDIDLTLITNSFVDERDLLGFIHTQLKTIISQNNSNRGTYKISKILNTRIPLLKIQIKDSKNNTFDVDLCINNVLGAINTKLMRAYAELHPLIMKGGVLIKIWAKKSGLVNQSEFSSYAFTLMFIYFMQEFYKVPILQQYDNIETKLYTLSIKRIICDRDNNFEDLNTQEDVFDTNFYFIYNNEQYKQIQDDLKIKLEKISLHEILKEFFKFYARGGQYHRNGIKLITLRNIDRDQNSRMFDIFDPLDIKHNPGEKPFRNGDRSQKENEICAKFYQAIQQMDNKNYTELFRK